MTFQHRPNSGTLFVNDRKEKANHPDYTGTALIDGKELRISGWKKVSPDGKARLSLSFQEPKPKIDPKARQLVKEYRGEDDDGDGIPF